MLIDVVEVEPLADWHLRLQFEDGVTGVVDIRTLVPLDGVLAPLRDAGFFAAVRVDPEAGTVVWPNGSDLDPDALYAAVTGQPLDLSSDPIACSA